MQAIVKRLIGIAICLIISIIAIHKTKARSPYHVPQIEYKVACIPAPKTKHEEDEIDEKLKPYFDLAYTSKEPSGSAIPSYRCYFKFPVGDVACMPPKVAKRNGKVNGCPQFVNTEESSCYFLKSKYRTLLNLLKHHPSKNLYDGKVVKNWKEIRDVLLGKK